jgi:hypothetical protein
LIGGQPTDAMRAQERHHGGAPEPEGRGGRGGEPHERPKPPFVGGGTEGERLRIKAVELLAQPTGEAPPLLAQLILHPRPLPKLNDQRILGRERPEGRLVGREGGGQYERIPTIIFGPRDRVAVAEAVELLGVEREDVEAAFEQRVDHRAPRHLQRDGDASGLPARELRQPLGEGVERHGLMGNGAFAQ